MSDDQHKQDPQNQDEDEKFEEPIHVPGVRQGNEMVMEEGKEAGRHTEEPTGAERPAGSSTSRDSTGINPKEPIDPESPNFPSE